MASQEIDDLLAPFGASIVVGGQAQEEQQFFAEIQIGALIGLASIFIILAKVFSSYTRPLWSCWLFPLASWGRLWGTGRLTCPYLSYPMCQFLVYRALW